MVNPLHTLAEEQEARALARYHTRYDNDLYRSATEGMDVATANLLIDHALALCGSPYFALSHRVWEPAAIRWLRCFTEETHTKGEL